MRKLTLDLKVKDKFEKEPLLWQAGFRYDKTNKYDNDLNYNKIQACLYLYTIMVQNSFLYQVNFIKFFKFFFADVLVNLIKYKIIDSRNNIGFDLFFLYKVASSLLASFFIQFLEWCEVNRLIFL